MSSFLCFICHNTVNSDSNEDTRDKYREVVGIHLCPDSHLCHICCHIVNKLWLFKSVCLKRSLEYPVLFSEKGTLNLQRTDIKNIILCTEENCVRNNVSQIYIDNRDQSILSNDYMKLEYDRSDFEDYFEKRNTETENVTNTIINITETIHEREIDKIQDIDTNNVEFDNNDADFDSNDADFDNEVADFDNNDADFDNKDADFDNKDADFDNKDADFDNKDADFENKDADFENNDKEFESDMSCSNDGNVFEYEIDNNENGYYECYDEDRNKIDSLNRGQSKHFESSKNTSKTKKCNKKGFEKILLSVEEQKSQLEAQRKSKKYIEAEFKCYNCGLGFLFKDTYQTHMMRHEESNGEYRCALCSLRFATGAVLRSHAALHSVRYRCERCGQYIRARQTHTHAKYCHNKASTATCHLCGRVFQDPSGLQQHLKRFHLTKKSNRSYSCSVCGKCYSNQAAVRTHMIKHIHRKFSCDQCSSTFSSPYTLTQHKKKHAPTADDQELQDCSCTSCGVTYTSRKSLLAHMRNSANHQQRAYDCPICNRSCPNERSLTSHISTVHSGTKPYQCQSCNARYSSRKSLVRHVRSHTITPQPKLAVCHICGNNFKGKSKLNRHLRQVCEKDKLEEELSAYYEQQNVIQLI